MSVSEAERNLGFGQATGWTGTTNTGKIDDLLHIVSLKIYHNAGITEGIHFLLCCFALSCTNRSGY